MKKILVPVKRVPDYECKIQVEGNDFKKEGIKFIINPFDEIAVEEALRIREGGTECEIVVVSVGADECSEQIRAALAMGADRGVLVKVDGYVDSGVAAIALAKVFEQESADLVIMGKQAIDSDANQTGQRLAHLLALPQATFASELKIEDSWESAEVTREVDGGLQKLKVNLPAVVTTDLRLNEPRFPSLPNIIKAKKKPLDTIELESVSARTEIVSMYYPEEKSAGVKVDSVEELFSKLREEAKVL